ncbi:MAG: FkbM family methyltransferase [Lachnospiraceae bacterium]|nr:FkbM family methyltransferase [Lachnospiraceae bacterium]
MGKLFLHELNRMQRISDKKFIIVGEGKIGKILNDFLALDENDYRIEAFLVDDGFRKQKSYRNLPVYEMTEFLQKENTEDYIFLNTVTSRDSGNYKEELVRKGIKNILDFNDADMALEMASEYWLKYFESKDIETSDEILKIGKFTFPNPFLDTVAKDVRYAFLTDVKDLVIPVWMGDYGSCEEGPYETEHVRIDSGDVVLDCGANIGISTANAIARNCEKVYSIEPVLNDSLLKCQKLFGERMSLHLLALSNYKGTADIYINPDASNDNSIYYIQNTLKERKTVDITTIDDFCRDEKIGKVDYIKLYIDDPECRMLLGAKETIIQHSPKIAIFPSLPHNVNALKQKLESIIESFNADYIVRYAWNKMFAYISTV